MHKFSFQNSGYRFFTFTKHGLENHRSLTHQQFERAVSAPTSDLQYQNRHTVCGLRKKEEKGLRLDKLTADITEHFIKEMVPGSAATNTVVSKEVKRRTLFATEDKLQFAVNRTDETERSKPEKPDKKTEEDLLLFQQAPCKAAHALCALCSEKKDEAIDETAKEVARLCFLVSKAACDKHFLLRIGTQNMFRSSFQSIVATKRSRSTVLIKRLILIGPRSLRGTTFQ